MDPRAALNMIITAGLVLSSTFMLWKGLGVVTGSPSPIVVVLSGSMEPAFHRGDILFLWNRDMETQVGEVVVYQVEGKPIPIVHRVIKQWHDERSNSRRLLTKGDNNAADDVELYARGQTSLNRERDVLGAVWGYVPTIGYATILLSDYPWLKTVALGGLAIMAVVQG